MKEDFLHYVWQYKKFDFSNLKTSNGDLLLILNSGQYLQLSGPDFFNAQIIFLDINMPVLDGINFIKSLENPPLLVITSAYSQFALETYELDVLDYLVKPIEFPRLMKAVNKINKRLNNGSKIPQENNKENPFIFVKIDKKKMKKIFLNEILVIESLKDYLKISTTSGKFIIHSTLSDFTSLAAIFL